MDGDERKESQECMGLHRSGSRCGTDRLDQYKTPGVPGIIRAQRKRARTRAKLSFWRVFSKIDFQKSVISSFLSMVDELNISIETQRLLPLVLLCKSTIAEPKPEAEAIT